MPHNEDGIPLEGVGYYDYAAELGMPYFHWGGIQATDRLVELLQISSESQVLIVGCGTRYTACYVADKTSLLPGVMTRDDDRRRKPGPREEPLSSERGQSPC